jgi:hypothetical protein
MNTPDIELPDRSRLRMAGAVAAVGLTVVAFAAVAWVWWGPLAGGLFVGGAVLGVSGPPIAILVLRDGLPLNEVLAVGLAIVAQIAFGQAALVRREDGRYEWTVLRGDAFGYHVELDDGTELAIDASEGELFRFGLGKLAITEVKASNVEEFTVLDIPGDSQQPIDERAGIPVLPPRQEDGGILVSLAAIQRRVRGSASSTLVRRGRDKALDEEGGTGQLSPLWTMAFAGGLLITGFGMTAVVLLL